MSFIGTTVRQRKGRIFPGTGPTRTFFRENFSERTTEETGVDPLIATSAPVVSTCAKQLIKFNTPDNFFGGKVSQFLHNWYKITSDTWLFKQITGYQLEFISKPVQYALPHQIKFSDIELKYVDTEVQKLLTKRVIERVTYREKDEFISSIFLRPKKDGTYRLILNLKHLNRDVEHVHFKMETLKSAVTLMTNNCWFASIDLKDAYYSIPVDAVDRKYLRFIWQGVCYQFTCLPNGLSSAPTIFAKIMKPVFSQLRKMGFSNVAYIDDSLLQADTHQQCVSNVETTVRMMDSLGLTIHPDKSVITPTQCITFLGFILNSVDMTVRLTKEKADKLVCDCNTLLKTREVTIRQLAQVIGKMVACTAAVPHAPLFIKTLEHEKDSSLKLAKGNFEQTVELSSEARQQVLWWINNIHSSASLVYRGSPDMTLETDSSMTGWGGLVKGDHTLRTGGHWSYSEQNNHINYLELLAAFLKLQCFCESKSNIHVRLYMDNTVAVNYLTNMGGKKPLLPDLTRKIWLWCKMRDIWLSVSHLPGAVNTEADKLSRKLSDDMEWKLNTDVFHRLTRYCLTFLT